MTSPSQTEGRATTSRLKRAVERLPSEIVAFASLSATSLASQAVRLFTGVINARLLTPSLYAINALGGVVVRYASYAHLGVQNGANRQIPVERGRGDNERAEKIAQTTFWVVLAACAAFAAAALGAALWPGLRIPSLPRSYYLDVTLLAVATLLYQYFNSMLISTQRQEVLARLRARYDIPSVIVATVSVLFFRLHGLLLVQSASMLLQSFLAAKALGFRPALRFDAGIVRELLGFGTPILLSSLAIYAFMTVDLVYVSRVYAQETVGLYGFALSSAFFFRTYAQSMADVLQPKMSTEFGREGETPECLRRFTQHYTFALIPILGMIAAVFFIGIPVLIAMVLPQYAASVDPFRFLLLAELALAVYIPSGHALTLLRKQVQLIAWVGLGIAIATLVFTQLVSPDTSLGLVASIWLAVSIGVSGGIVLMAEWYTGAHRIDVRSVAGSAALLAAVGALIWGFGAVGPRGQGILALLGIGALRLVLLEVALLTLMLIAGRGNPLVERVRSVLGSLVQRPVQP